MIAAACLAALLTGQTADLISTARLHPPYEEGNPFLPHHVGGIVAIKASATGALTLTGWRIRKTHPRLAATLFLLGALSGTIGAWHNTHLRYS